MFIVKFCYKIEYVENNLCCETYKCSFQDYPYTTVVICLSEADTIREKKEEKNNKKNMDIPGRKWVN